LYILEILGDKVTGDISISQLNSWKKINREMRKKKERLQKNVNAKGKTYRMHQMGGGGGEAVLMKKRMCEKHPYNQFIMGE
jgi:hypothetical protein